MYIFILKTGFGFPGKLKLRKSEKKSKISIEPIEIKSKKG